MQYFICLLLLGFIALEAKPNYQFVKTSAEGIWSDCTKPGDHGKIEDIVIDPNPLRAGADVSVMANITVDEDITGGVITVQIKIGPFPYQQNFELCKALSQVDAACPISKGLLGLVFKTHIPATSPKVKYTGTAVASDQNGKEIFCIKMDFDLS